MAVRNENGTWGGSLRHGLKFAIGDGNGGKRRRFGRMDLTQIGAATNDRPALFSGKCMRRETCHHMCGRHIRQMEPEIVGLAERYHVVIFLLRRSNIERDGIGQRGEGNDFGFHRVVSCDSHPRSVSHLQSFGHRFLAVAMGTEGDQIRHLVGAALEESYFVIDFKRFVQGRLTVSALPLLIGGHLLLH